jgi:Transposase DDE domain
MRKWLGALALALALALVGSVALADMGATARRVWRNS